MFSSVGGIYPSSLDTASLAADTSDKPFALSLQLNSGGTSGVSNTATFSNFNYFGGSAGSTGSIQSSGDVSPDSSLANGVTAGHRWRRLQQLQSEFYYRKRADVSVADYQQLVDPSTDTPDLLAVQILDSAGNAVPTFDPDMTNSLVVISYTDPLDIQAFGADTSQTTSAGQTLAFSAPTVTADDVPESASLRLVVASGLVLLRRRRQG